MFWGYFWSQRRLFGPTEMGDLDASRRAATGRRGRVRVLCTSKASRNEPNVQIGVCRLEKWRSLCCYLRAE